MSGWDRFHAIAVVVLIPLAYANLYAAHQGGRWEWLNWTGAILCSLSAALNGYLLVRRWL